MRKVFRASAIARAMATPLHYVKDIRWPEAQRLVRAGRASINAIDFEVGYGSPSQFSREYGRKSGVPSGQDLMAAGRADRPHRSHSEIIRKLH